MEVGSYKPEQFTPQYVLENLLLLAHRPSVDFNNEKFIAEVWYRGMIATDDREVGSDTDLESLASDMIGGLVVLDANLVNKYPNEEV